MWILNLESLACSRYHLTLFFGYIYLPPSEITLRESVVPRQKGLERRVEAFRKPWIIILCNTSITRERRQGLKLEPGPQLGNPQMFVGCSNFKYHKDAHYPSHE